MPQETPNFTDAAVFKHSASGFTPASGSAAVYVKSDNKLYVKDSSGTEAAASGGIGGSTGSVDNAILRADGTGGSTSQSSDLVIDDAVVPFNITGDAGTDVITAVGHNFTTNQGVRFPTLTGGSGLNTTTNYFVRDISGDTFKVSTTSGGSAVNFTTNITAGTVIAMQASVAIRNNSSETNSALLLLSKGTGAIIAQRPDGTTTGGNPRGAAAVDFQQNRAVTAAVASGDNSGIFCGRRNTASGQDSAVLSGFESTASGTQSVVAGGARNAPSGTYSGILSGDGNAASGQSAAVLGGYLALADRYAMQAHASGQFATRGDAQRARFFLRNKTTTNSAVELFMAEALNVRLTIPSGKVMAMLINITGVKSDGSAVAHYVRQYCIKNVGGTTSEVYAAATVGTDNAAGTSITLSANDTNDAVKIECVGIASETWRWVASVDAVEVAYGT